MKQVDARVISIEMVLPGLDHHHARVILGSYLMWLDSPEIAAGARPGQYVMVRCGADAALPRPFSIHRVVGGKLAILFAAYEGGRGTPWLAARRAGDSLNVFGPLGNGFSLIPKTTNSMNSTNSTNSLLLVAGGIGVAPLCFLADEALKNRRVGGAKRNPPQTVTLLYGTADKDRYADFPKGIEVVAATEDGSVGHKGMITEILADYATKADQVFACGPPAMYRAMAKIPALAGKPVQVSMEVGMGCGRGVCYGCTIKTRNGLKKVCQDGPVFELGDLMWDAR